MLKVKIYKLKRLRSKSKCTYFQFLPDLLFGHIGGHMYTTTIWQVDSKHSVSSQSNMVTMRLLTMSLMVLLSVGVSESASSMAVPLPSYVLQHCPRYVRSSRDLRRFPICCLHPTVRRRFSTECSELLGLSSTIPPAPVVQTIPHHVIVPVDTEDARTKLNRISAESPETITVTCCKSGKTETCGKGVGCMDVCDEGEYFHVNY